MANVLVLAEISGGKVKKTTHSAVTFARKAAALLGGSYSILALGSDVSAVLGELAALGADKVLVAEAPTLEHYLAEHYAPVVAAAAGSFRVLVATASAFGKDLLPRVAARLDAGYAADVTELLSEGTSLRYKRPMFAGNAFGICRIESAVEVVSVRQSAFTAAEPTGSSSPVERLAVPAAGAGASRIEWVNLEQVKNERPELTEARVVVSGGRALKEQFYELLNPFADVLGAAIGASRAACDNGYCAPDLQVGQTGKVVAPALYFAVGISGAIQHLAGMKSSKIIVAINKDGDAPIFQVADYGLVGDLFKVLPELTTKLRALKDA
ncbi:MAG: electron transfer flavoprotein subunit alpha/FixB family protein [Myxococcales bacterium]|nr:electron transfer flavoprotein subunit alpha/FixB family protein [Myxococcales bacterium]